MNDTTKELKAIVDASDSIDKIQTYIEMSIQQKAPPDSFCPLVTPLFIHSVHHPANLIQTYADVLVDMHVYLNECLALVDNAVIFKQVVNILQDALHLYETKSDLETLFDTPIQASDLMRSIVLASTACLDILRTFDGSELDPMCDTLWQLLLRSMDMLLSEDTLDEQKDAVITKLAAMAESLLRQHIIVPSDEEIFYLLKSMVLATLNCASSLEHGNIIASCISSVCTSHPNVSFFFPLDLSDLLNSLANSIKQADSHTLCKAMFNASFLLAKNNAATPWLSDFNTIQYDDPEIELLKENIAACYVIPEDQVDFTQIQDMAGMQENYKGKASGLIAQLVSGESDAEETTLLLNMIELLAVHSGARSFESVCMPHMKAIVEYTAKLLLKDPAMAASIIDHMGYPSANFFKHYLHFALPYAVLYASDEDALVGLCNVFEQTPIELVRQGATHILIATFLEPDTAIQEAGERRLDDLCGQRNVLKELVFDYRTSTVAAVAMSLGHPTQGQVYYRVMEQINRNIREVLSMADFLHEFMMAILESVFSYIAQAKKQDPSQVEHPYALKSLMIVMQLLEDNINHHNRHLIKVFGEVLQLPNMQSKALDLWKTYIEHLSQDAVRFNINAIIQGLCGLLAVSPAPTRVQVASTLHDLLVHNRTLTAEDYANLPVLPAFEELAAVQRLVNEHQDVKVEKEVLNIILGFTKFDDGLVLSNLQKLKHILANNPYTGHEIERLYAHLFHLIRKYSSHEMITYYASLCLGLLGACDPSTIHMRAIDDTVFVMRNHNNDNETIDFVYDLIMNRIFPSYNAASTSNQSRSRCMEYAIQTLLRTAGFAPIKEMRKTRTAITYKRWIKFPRDVQEFLAPFLESAYQGAWPNKQEDYPIFSRALSFKDWVHRWFRCMANTAQGTASHIYKACLPMLEHDMTAIALHLLPYMVLHTIMSGTPEAVQGVAGELGSVLAVNARPVDTPEKLGLNRAALQVAVAITTYCRKWLYQVGRDDVVLGSVVDRVTQFLQKVPDRDMGEAALSAGAYPLALMHFETDIKERHGNAIPNRAMADHLRMLYLETEQLEDYQALMDVNAAAVGSRDEQIAQHMNLGQWDYAETLYRSKIDDTPLDLSAYTGYLECLSRAKRFGSLLYEADHKLAGATPWQPQINAYRIDAAWHEQDWPALQKAVAMPTERNARALVGCALHHMKHDSPLQLAHTLDEARANITQQIATATSDSYRKHYPRLFELQLLQELETSRDVWKHPRASDQLQAIQPLWKDTLKRVKPRSQYRLRLLELRKAAFFDIRDASLTKPYEAELWLHLYRENRKLGDAVASLDALKHAEKLVGHPLNREMAKWHWKKGQVDKAIALLQSFANRNGKWEPHDALLMSDIIVENIEGNRVKLDVYKAVFRSIQNIEPEKLEKAYYNISTFYGTDPTYLQHESLEHRLRATQYVIRTSCNALQHGSKYYYSTMSRMWNLYISFSKTVKEAEINPDLPENQLIIQLGHSVHKLVVDAGNNIRPFQFILFLTRLISHLTTESVSVSTCLQNAIKRCFMAYPKHTIWLLLSALDSDSPRVASRMKVVFDKSKTQCPDNSITRIIMQATEVKDAFYKILNTHFEDNVAVADLNEHGRKNPFAGLQDLDLYMPNEATIMPTLPDVIEKNDDSINPFPDPLPTIKSFDSKITIMRSLQRPKRIKIMGSDGKVYSFLLKKEDDLRNDARTMEFFYMINHFLKKNVHSRDSELYIRTFAIVPLGKRWGLIQWIDNLSSLKSIVNGYLESHTNWTVNQIGQKMGGYRVSLEKDRIAFFKKQILPISPPMFYKWFLQHFPEPSQWLSSRSRYTKTLAVMSIVGYIIGLGDRHAENIMFDVATGDAVHVDLNLVFGKGEDLPVPEIVPFRLTRNLTHAMGPLQATGLFKATCETTMAVLLRNKDSLYSVFETLLNELNATEAHSSKLPLRHTQKGTNKIMGTLQTRFNMDRSDVNKKVQELIDQASSPDKLALMFPGWAPYV